MRRSSPDARDFPAATSVAWSSSSSTPAPAGSVAVDPPDGLPTVIVRRYFHLPFQVAVRTNERLRPAASSSPTFPVVPGSGSLIEPPVSDQPLNVSVRGVPAPASPVIFATIGELAAGLAHELRNPLAGIGGVLRVLAGQLRLEDTTRGLLADVQAQVARMDKTLTDLLEHAHPAAPTMIGLDVNELLEQSLRFLPRSTIEIVRQFDDSLPPLRADPGLLHQAFLNILVNARQAMPQGGRLTLRTQLDETDGRTVRVLISDTGAGIAPEHLGRVFEAFFTTKSRGTGLGLAIAARAVEQHGGRIEVASGSGRGTTFTIALPVGPAMGCGRRDAHAVSCASR